MRELPSAKHSSSSPTALAGTSSQASGGDSQGRAADQVVTWAEIWEYIVVATAYIYWPKAWEYAVPWAAGPALYIVLGAFDLPSGRPIMVARVPTSLQGLLLAFLLALNALFLWIHLRPQFLTWRSGRRRFVGTFILLTAGHLLVWGLVQCIRGHVRPAVVPSNVDWRITLEQAGLALVGFWLVLLVTAIWKIEEPGVSNVRLEREKAKELIGKLTANTLSRQEFRDLEPTLKQFEASAGSLAARLEGADLDLIRSWREAAQNLLPLLEGKDFNDVARLHEEANQELTQASARLARQA